MLEYLTLGAFTVALLMSLAALCAFAWAASSGAFENIEAVKHSVLTAVQHDRDESPHGLRPWPAGFVGITALVAACAVLVRSAPRAAAVGFRDRHALLPSFTR